jgi:hypothetical protein
MRSSDTPASDRDELEAGEQGPVDWSQEEGSDDRLSGEAAERLERREHRAGDELGGEAELELDDDDQADDDELVDEP